MIARKTVLAALLAGIVLSGCGGELPPSATVPQDARPVTQPSVAIPQEGPPVARPAATVPEESNVKPASDAAVPRETEVVPPMDAAALHAALLGTSWSVGDLQISFLDEQKVFAKGGMVADLTIEGLTASYTLDNGVITATAAGRTLTATWDGQTLRVAGNEAVRIK